MSEKPQFHPVQNDGRLRTVPASVVMQAYEVYTHVFGSQPAMIDLARGCRGGFSVGELIAFLYARQFPKAEWAKRVDEALERQ